MRVSRLLALGIFAALAACSQKPETDAELAARAGAPLFKGMGEFHRVIDTKDAGAQRYFDQGMVLAFGFNHAEAIRSFRAAQKLDPDCAMCFWGEALATGRTSTSPPRARRSCRPTSRRRHGRRWRRRRRLRAGKPRGGARPDRGAGQALCARARRRTATRSTMPMPRRSARWWRNIPRMTISPRCMARRG